MQHTCKKARSSDTEKGIGEGIDVGQESVGVVNIDDFSSTKRDPALDPTVLGGTIGVFKSDPRVGGLAPGKKGVGQWSMLMLDHDGASTTAPVKVGMAM